MSKPDAQNDGREKAFVEHVIARSKIDAGYAAMMRHGDNPDTDYYAYEPLASFIDLDDDRKRLPYALIGAAICREKAEKDGAAGIGEVLAKCCADSSDKGNLSLQRLLSCGTIQEACSIIRRILSLAQSREPGSLSYARLLKELVQFEASNMRQKKIKQGWAMDFYAISPPDEIVTEDE